jgi:beta-lactamase regulating signal transducer with metallopeptidase domain/uncharacterized GH25 family protein
MNNASTHWSSVILVLIELATTWWLQATILLVIGLLAATLLHKPVWQSFVFRVTIASVLLCPFLAQLLSLTGSSLLTIDLHSQILSQQQENASTTLWVQHHPNLQDDALLAESSVDSLASFDDFRHMNSPAEKDFSTETDGGTIAADTLAEGSKAPRQASVASAGLPETGTSQSMSSYFASQLSRYGMLALAIWIAGTTVLMVRLLFDLAHSQSLRRQAGRVDEQCENACHQLAKRLQLNQHPEVLVNPFLSSPCLIGHWRPAILLPEDIEVSCYDQVFLHELAHLRRGDWLWCVVGRIAHALLWCQPLIWWLHRRNLSVAEVICDDYVIQHGCNRESYLQQLIQIAERSLPQKHAVGVSMVGFRSQLGYRAVRIVDTTRVLSTQVGKVFVASSLLGTLVVILAVGSIDIGQASPAIAGQQAGNSAPSATPTPAATSAVAATPTLAATPSAVTTLTAATDSAPVSQSDDASAQEKRPANAPRTYSGKVLNPDGTPLAGVTVSAMNKAFSRSDNRWHYSKKLAETSSDADGSYSITFQPEEGNNELVAQLDGFAPDVVSFTKLHELFEQNTTSLDLRLSRLKLISGRIVDSEGNPVSGVNVRVVDIVLPISDEAVEKWIANAKPDRLKGQNNFVMMSNDPRITETQFSGRAVLDGEISMNRAIETNANGEFQLNGIGENHLVHLRLSGPTIALRDALIVGRDMPSLLAFHNKVRDNDFTHYGASPTIVASPSQLITGVVVDADSGEPLANTKIVISRVGKSTWRSDAIAASTDPAGRFQLTGAPLGGGHVVEVRPELDQPYFKTHLELPASSASTPLQCRFELPRTKWIVGRITDEDGQPLAATLNYYPYRNNEYAVKYTNFEQRITGHAPDYETKSGPDGRFRIRAIAGPAVLAAFITENSEQPRYIPNRSEELLQRIGGEQMSKLFNSWSADFFDALVEVNIDPAAEEITQDLVLKKGQVRPLHVADVNGEAIESVSVLGTTFPPRYNRNDKLSESKVEIIGLQPDESRLVVLMSADGRSGKMLTVNGSDASPLDVRLERCATVVGRVLDQDAQPVPNIEVHITPVQEPSQDNWSRDLGPVTTDANGRFETYLAPGGLYSLWAYTSLGPNFRVSIRPGPGVTYQLGELKEGMELTEEKSAKLLETTKQ